MRNLIGYFSTPAFLIVSLALLFAPLSTLAQNQAGVSISPSLIEEGADPGQVIDKSLVVRNLSDTEKTYYLFTRDIIGVRGAATPIFAEEGTEKTGYEITEWLEIGRSEVTILPGQDTTIPLTINVPDSATPGSHFGGVFISLEPPRFRQIGAGVGFDVANIISIRISGDVLESAQIRSFATDKFIYGSTNVTFDTRLENKGNVLVRPYGPLEVNNMFGERVAFMTFNENLGGVFPSTIRDFDMTWQEDTPGFGRYTAKLSLLYGEPGAQQTVTSETSFWILPMNIIGPALGVLAVLLLVTFVAVRLYIRSRVGKLSHGRRVVGRRARRSSSSTLMVVLTAMLSVTALFLLLLLILFA